MFEDHGVCLLADAPQKPAYGESVTMASGTAAHSLLSHGENVFSARSKLDCRKGEVPIEVKSREIEPMLKILDQINKATKPYRQRYGQVSGYLLWLRLRRHLKLSQGMLHEVRVPHLLHPVVLRAGTSDVIVFTQIFVHGELDFEVPVAPSTILDAGANIGMSAIYFTHRFPKAKIVTLEVDESNFELLQRNTKHYPNIICLRKALWSYQTQMSIVNPTDEPWAFRVEKAAGDSASSVASLGVSDLMREFEWRRIDLLKIDIEGAEKEVFQNGAQDWIDRVGLIAVELHERYSPGCREALDDALRGRDFSMCQSGEYTIVDLKDS